MVIDPGEQEVEDRASCWTRTSTSPCASRRARAGDTAFRAEIGAPAVRELLKKLDIKKLAEELRASVATETSQHRKKQMLKRLKIVDAFLCSGDTGRHGATTRRG